MGKKIILLVFLVMLLTGCDISYNLSINEDTFTESTVFNTTTADGTKEYLYNLYREEYPIYIDQEYLYYDPYSQITGNDYYTKNYNELDTGYIFNYQASYNYDDFSRARSLNTVFNTIGVGYLDAEDYYYLSMSGIKIFNYNNTINTITINIDFDRDAIILSNNADTVSGNTYTWQLNPSNLKDIDITYKFLHLTDPDPKPESPEENNPGNSDNEQNEDVSNWVNDNKLLVFGGVFVILVCVIIIISVIKSKKL